MARPTQAQAQRAARLWGSAEAIRTAIGAPMMSSISKRLVAQGLTDAPGTDQLVISPRTVNKHLTAIYNKLGVDTRTAASRFAVDQQLI